MDKTTRKLAWRVLPAEFREEVKSLYNRNVAENSISAYATIETLFGLHNLTSDAEGEEILTCEKSIAQHMVKSAIRSIQIHDFEGNTIASQNMATFNRGIKFALDQLFGSKCLPDEVADEDNFASKEPRIEDGEKESFTYPKFRTGDKVLFNNNICRIIGADREDAEYQLERIIDNHPMGWAEENEISLYEEPKPAEPKFKRGDKAKIVGGNPEFIGKVVEIEAVDSKGTIVVYLPNAGHSTYKKDYLEPYTEPTANYLRSEGALNTAVLADNYGLASTCDKQFDNIIKDGFKNHNRLHIAAILAAGMLASEVRCYPVDRALELADALIDKCEKGVNNA